MRGIAGDGGIGNSSFVAVNNDSIAAVLINGTIIHIPGGIVEGNAGGIVILHGVVNELDIGSVAKINTIVYTVLDGTVFNVTGLSRIKVDVAQLAVIVSTTISYNAMIKLAKPPVSSRSIYIHAIPVSFGRSGYRAIIVQVTTVAIIFERSKNDGLRCGTVGYPGPVYGNIGPFHFYHFSGGNCNRFFVVDH
jgi:hypothetical protein